MNSFHICGSVTLVAVLAFILITFLVFSTFVLIKLQTDYRQIEELKATVSRLENRLDSTLTRKKRDIQQEDPIITPCIQFEGYLDTSQLNFRKNYHMLRHFYNRAHFTDWKLSDWVQRYTTENYFQTTNGTVEIFQSGLYLIYAQIYYLDEFDEKGFKVYRNNNAILHCVSATHSNTGRKKGVTCFTSGIEQFQEHDLIYIKDTSNGRISIMEPGKSFFGLIKLN